MAAIALGDTVPDVGCGACRRPEFVYSPQDLKILDRAIQSFDRRPGTTPEDVLGLLQDVRAHVVAELR